MNLSPNAALLVVDAQHAVNDASHGRRNNPQAEANIARLLEAWRETGRPIIHVKHNSRLESSTFHASKPGNAIMDVAQPLAGEPLIEKDVNSAFIGTDLEQRLKEAGISTLVIVGFTTNHCVETTTRMAGNLDFETFLVSDGTATHGRVGPDGQVYDAETIHSVSLASLHGEFATVVDTSSVLAALDTFAQV